MDAFSEELISIYLSGTFTRRRIKKYLPRLITFHNEEVIFKEGHRAKAVHLLCKGKVVVMKQSVHNVFITIETVQPGEILGLPAVISNQLNTTSAVALGKVHTFEIPKDDLISFLQNYPNHQFTIANLLSKKVLYYENLMYRYA